MWVWADKIHARGDFTWTKCALGATSGRQNERSGRLRGDNMRARAVLGAKKCVLGANFGRLRCDEMGDRGDFGVHARNDFGAKTCALVAFAERKHARSGRLRGNKMRARGSWAKPCALEATSGRQNARLGRSRSEKVRARGNFGAKQCAFGAFSERQTCALGAIFDLKRCTLGAISDRQNVLSGRQNAFSEQRMRAQGDFGANNAHSD